MKTQQGADNSHHEPLPLDMVIEILTKLPTKSLFRFRCVSKQWCSIIRSRPFINSFLSVSLSRPRILLGYVIKRGTERRLFFLSLPLHPQDSNYSSVIFKYEVPFNNYYGFCNSVRGIICVSVGNHFMICNPTTKQVITIPNDPTGFNPKHNMFRTTTSMYLGYDESNDQYKIMRTMKTQVRPPENSVCTLKLGEQSSFSSWRRVESDNGSYFCHTNALCINGVVYYGAQKNLSNSFVVIVSFDVASERLLLMEAPKENNLLGLINYQGKLGCFCFTNDKGFSLWILDDAKKQIWSKTCVFSSSFCDSYRKFSLRTCGATDAGEIIFVSKLFSDACELFYYDIKKNNVSKRVKIGDIAEVDDLRHPHSTVVHVTNTCDHVENIIYL